MTIFGLKAMVKSGLEKNILKFHVPLQSCCCPVQKNLPRRAELAWLVSRYLWRGAWNFKIIFSRPLFTIILSQKRSFQDFLVTYSSRFRWCGMPVFFKVSLNSKKPSKQIKSSFSSSACTSGPRFHPFLI